MWIARQDYQNIIDRLDMLERQTRRMNDELDYYGSEGYGSVRLKAAVRKLFEHLGLTVNCYYQEPNAIAITKAQKDA